MPYWRVHFYIKSLSKIGFYHSGVYVSRYSLTLGAYSSTLDYSLAHSASGEGPSVSSAIKDKFVMVGSKISIAEPRPGHWICDTALA